MRMNGEGCPICGHPEFTALDEHGCPTYEICQCCGCESGYEYDPLSDANRYLELRRQWMELEPKKKSWLGGRPTTLADRAKLRSKKERQLRQAGLTVPE